MHCCPLSFRYVEKDQVRRPIPALSVLNDELAAGADADLPRAARRAVNSARSMFAFEGGTTAPLDALDVRAHPVPAPTPASRSAAAEIERAV
jgi:hypothetical protein